MNESPAKLFNACIVRFTHPEIRCRIPFSRLWGITAAGEVVCARNPQALVGNTIQTRDGEFVIEGTLLTCNDTPLEYREALELGVTPAECVEFSHKNMSAEDVMKVAEARRLKKIFIGKDKEDHEGIGL